MDSESATQGDSLQYCTIQHSTVQSNTVQCRAIKYSSVKYSTDKSPETRLESEWPNETKDWSEPFKTSVSFRIKVHVKHIQDLEVGQVKTMVS